MGFHIAWDYHKVLLALRVYLLEQLFSMLNYTIIPKKKKKKFRSWLTISSLT